MFAGKMRLNHLLLIVGSVAALGIGGSVVMCKGDSDEKKSEDKKSVATKPPEKVKTPPPRPDVSSTTPSTAITTPSTTTSSTTATTTENDKLRPVDRELMEWVGKDLGSKKKKDAVKGNAWKINLYQDAGKSVMNRAKVDLDRDDRWDEKWTFDGKNIARKVSPNDDEDYSKEFDWSGSEWAPR